MELRSHNAAETEAMGAHFAEALRPGDVVAFSGDLGAGKTAFCRGILRGLGYTGRVTSPTFAIANEYDCGDARVVHLDLYRLADAEALYEIGFDDYLDGARILLIEWSEHAAALLPARHKTVHIAYGAAADDRILTLGET